MIGERLRGRRERVDRSLLKETKGGERSPSQVPRARGGGTVLGSERTLKVPACLGWGLGPLTPGL